MSISADFLDDLADLGPSAHPIANFDAPPSEAELAALFDLESAGAFDAVADGRTFR